MEPEKNHIGQQSKIKEKDIILMDDSGIGKIAMVYLTPVPVNMVTKKIYPSLKLYPNDSIELKTLTNRKEMFATHKKESIEEWKQKEKNRKQNAKTKQSFAKAKSKRKTKKKSKY